MAIADGAAPTASFAVVAQLKSETGLLRTMMCRLAVIFTLACCLDWASARYHEKTRFDRSVTSDGSLSQHARMQEAFNKKQRILTDYESHYTAYKDAAQSICYIEKMRNNRFDDVNSWRDVIRRKKKNFHSSDRILTKIETWRLAGDRIVEFCKGLKLILLEEEKPSHSSHPYHNELPQSDNDIHRKHILMSETNRMRKREARGRFRGQTQSQYLSVGNEKEGKAEAEATQQSSRAVVSGSSGMGQAQSMSSGTENCEGCPGYIPGSVMSTLGSQQGSANGDVTAGVRPGTALYPATSSPVTYPTSTQISEVSPRTQIGGRGTYPTESIGTGHAPGLQILGGQPGLQIPGGQSPDPRIHSGSGQLHTGNQVPIGTSPLNSQTIGVLQPGIQATGQSPSTSSFPGIQVIGNQPGTKIASGIPGVQVTGGQPIFTGGTYPSQIQPSAGTYPGSGVPSQLGGTYPATITDNTARLFPGGSTPGGSPATQMTSGSVYPPGIQFTGGGRVGTQIPVTYPVGAHSPGGIIGPTVSGSPGISFPGSITYPLGIQVGGGSTAERGYPVNTQMTGGTTMSAGSIPRGTYLAGAVIATGGTSTAGSTVYPSGTQVTGGIYPTDTQSAVGTFGIGDGTAYPPGTQRQISAYPAGTQSAGSTGIGNNGAYSPGTQLPTATNIGAGTQISGGPYPVGPGVIGNGVYPGGVIPGTVPATQTGTGGYYQDLQNVPGSTYPGNAVTGTHTIPGNSHGSIPGTISGIPMVPGITTQGFYPGSLVGPLATGVGGSHVNGAYPPGVPVQNNQIPSLGVQGTKTGPAVSTIPVGVPAVEIQKSVSRGDIPGTTVYPSESGQPGVPAGGIPTTVSGIAYPSSTTGGAKYPVSGTIGYPGVNVIPGQYSIPAGQQNVGGIPVLSGQPLPGPSVSIPGSSGIITGPDGQITGQGQNNVAGGGDDASDSQAQSSVKQDDAGTHAMASAEGRHGQGSAKSQVSGTYSGGGSFSAQAGTSDNSKSVQTQVSGGKEGAKSSAQGSGGLGKSQVQVQLDSESGATLTNAQSSGWNHGTNSQVQASSKGGMADAQANGEGQTSSQAQIGFQPYVNRNEKFEKRDKPFRGGGSASAQSGTFRGQSQSQLQGSFHYGITYSGAAQAGSGSGAAALRKPFNFTNDQSLFKPFKFDKESTTTETPQDQLQGAATSSRRTIISITPKSPSEKKNYDDDYEEYEDEEYENKKTTASSTRQTMRFVTDGDYDIKVKQEESTGRSLPGFARQPKVTSVAGEKTIAQGDGKSQSQSVTIIPINRTTQSSRGDVKVQSSDTRSLHSERVGGFYFMKVPVEESSSPKTNYVSVSNSVAGKINDENSNKNYEHTYYTKSSTCGYFTFSCNVVYGSNGKRKICKPKLPTYSDGTSKC